MGGPCGCSMQMLCLSAQGQGHLEQMQGHEEAGPGVGGGFAGDKWQLGVAGAGGCCMLSETALGCHWHQLRSAVTSPGARTGHCQAKRQQHTACPW